MGAVAGEQECADRARVHRQALEEVERCSSGGREDRLDRVGVADSDDGLARVGTGEIGHGLARAGGHLEEGLAVWESEARRVRLDLAPLGLLGEPAELLVGPVAEVALDEPRCSAHPQAKGTGDRLGCLASPLQR